MASQLYFYYSKVMFTLLRIVSSTTVSELYFTYVLISFLHGYSATLAAKLIIKLDLCVLITFKLFCLYAVFIYEQVNGILRTSMATGAP